MKRNAQISIEEFRKVAASKLSYLEKKGFIHTLSLEESTSIMATLIYVGKYVAFEFSLDVRDQCVDVEVVKVEGGRLLRGWDGGYSSDIYTHLVQKESYRGSPTGGISHAETDDRLVRLINGFIGLLDVAGQNLLADSPNSLS